VSFRGETTHLTPADPDSTDADRRRTRQHRGSASVPTSDAGFIGFAVTSHNTAATATAMFDDVRIVPF
jgi:hypothetical protein